MTAASSTARRGARRSGSPCSAPPTRTATSSTGTTSRTREYDDAAHNDIGLAKISTLVNGDARRSAGAAHAATLDAGDTIQGTPLAYYYAKIEPITQAARPPDGRRDEPDRLRRRRARQPRVQLRHRHAADRSSRSSTSRCSAPTRVDPTTGAPAFPPYVIKTFKVTPARQAASRSASSAWSPPASRSGTRPTSRARCSSPASSSRPRCSCRELKRGAPTSSSSRPLGRRHVLVVRRRAAVPRERRHAAGPAGARTSTRSSSATRTWRSPSASSPTTRPASRCCSASRSTGACGCGHGPRPRAGSSGRWTGRVRARRSCSTPTPSPEDPASPRLLRPQHDKVVAYVNCVIGTVDHGRCRAAHLARRGHRGASTSSTYVQAGAVKAALAGTRRGAAGAVDRRAVQPRRGVPGRAT